MKKRIKLIFLQICSFFVSIAPLVVILCLHWDDYTKTPSDTTKLCFGGMLIVGLVFLKAIDKLHMPNRIVSFGILFLVAYLLQKLMQDIVLISGMALLGEMIDVIFFQRWIRKTRETIIIEKTADVTTGKVEDVLRRYMGGGA